MSTAPIKWFTGRSDDAIHDWQLVEDWLSRNVDFRTSLNTMVAAAFARRPNSDGWLFRIEGEDGDFIIDAEIDYDADVTDSGSMVNVTTVVSVTIRRADQ